MKGKGRREGREKWGEKMKDKRENGGGQEGESDEKFLTSTQWS